MERKIKVGENEAMFKSSAATNILYKKAFGEDILIKLTEYTKNLKELKKIQSEVKELQESGKTQEEILEKMNELMASDAFVTTQNFTNETLPRLAYIMLLEGNEKIGDIFSKLNENSYLAWLMTINQDELLDVTGEVMDLWQSGAKTHSKPKN